MMPRPWPIFAWLLVLPLAFGWTASLVAEVEHVQNGVLDGVPYKVVHPESTDGPQSLLLFCHGHIPEGFPLEAYLPYARQPHLSFLREGWTLAASAYRRNGLIIADAMEDTLALYDFLLAESSYDRVLLLGTSMGGAVALHLLETFPERFDGALILGRGLEVREPGDPLPFKNRLEDPVLLLTNQSETEAPSAYQAAFDSRSPFYPSLWIVRKEGHILFTNGEYEEAVYALLASLEGRRPASRKFYHIPPEIGPSGAEIDPGSRSARTKVSDRSPTYGNLEIRINEPELDSLGLSQGDSFTLAFSGADFPILIPWVSTYSDVPAGAFLAFINEFGFLQVAVNQGHAGNRTGLQIGDPVTLSPSLGKSP